MSPDNERVFEICRRVTQEKDHERLMTLVKELNQLLENRPPKKAPENEENTTGQRGSHG